MATCPTRRHAVTLAALTLLMLGAGGLIPAPAHALELDPPPSVEEILKAIIDELFKVKPANLNGDFLQWLIALPDFVGKPGNGAVDGDLADLVGTTTAIAFGVFTAVATWAVVHYWVSGISFLRSSGTELLEGISRSIGVALLIIGWPMIFANAVALVNSISAALVDRPGLDRLAEMLTGAMGSDKLFEGGVAMILGVVISIAAIVLVMGLAITKVVMTVALAVLYVWMPIAFVIWPVPWLSFITQASIRALISLLGVLVLWAACLATFLAVGEPVLRWGTRGSVFVDGVAEPFVAIALLTTLMMVTRLILRLNVSGGMGGGGGGGGGGVGHLAAPLASVVSTAAGAPMGPAGVGLGPHFAAPGGETATQQPVHGSTGERNASEHQGAAGQPGAAGTGSPGVGARTVATPTGASAPTQATAAGSAAAYAGRGSATSAAHGSTAGAGAGQPASAEQPAESQAAGAGKPGEPDAADHGRAQAPDEQPATGGSGGRAPVDTLGEQAPGEAARPADAAAGTTPGSGAPGQSHGADTAAPGSAAAPAAGSQSAGQPGGAGGPGGRGADGAGGSPAAGSGAADAQAATPPSGSATGGDESATAGGAPGGESASQSAPSADGGGPAGGGGGQGQPNGSPGAAARPTGANGGPPGAGSGDSHEGASGVSYDWVAGEFRPSEVESAPSTEAGDSEPTQDDDVSDVSYTGILEAGEGDHGMQSDEDER